MFGLVSYSFLWFLMVSYDSSGFFMFLPIPECLCIFIVDLQILNILDREI